VKTPKESKAINRLTHVTDEQRVFISESSRAFRGQQDAGRLVVKRTVVMSLLEGVLGVRLTEKVFNQVVVLASRGLPRMPLTVRSTSSRLNYLLAEVSREGQAYSPAVLVLEFALRNPEVIAQARINYHVAAREGLATIRAWINSKH
jgi:hypothetical protein